MAKQILRSLVIGLGGTGQKAIIELKKRMLQRYGEIPEVIRFLSIDSDIIKEQDEDFSYEYLNRKEKVAIKIETNEKIFLEPGNFLTYYKKQKYFKDFLHPNFLEYAPESATGDGANGKRIVGKMLIAKNYDTLKDRIHDAVGEVLEDEVITRVKDKGYEISAIKPIFCFVIGSWSGGTGSGTFIDIANIIKGYDNQIRTIGFFAMPGYFTPFPFQENAKNNAYGAFVEIDFLQNPSTFSNRSINAPTIDGQYIEQMRYNSIYIMQKMRSNKSIISKETMEAATALAISNMMSAIGDKVYSAISNNNQFSLTMGGKKRGYTGFGVCEIVLERDSLIKHLKHKLIFNALSQYNSNNIDVEQVKNSVDKFIVDNFLDEGIGESALKINQVIDSLYKLNNRELTQLFHEIEDGDSVKNDLENAKIIYEQSIHQKADTLINLYSINEKTTNLRNKIEDVLYAKGGVYRSSAFARSIVKQFEEMKKWLNIEISSHKKTLEEQESKLGKIIDEIQKASSGILSFWRKKQIKNLIESYTLIVSNPSDKKSIRNLVLEIKRKSKAVEIYNDLIKVASEYFREVGEITKGVIPVLNRNLNETIDKLSLNLRQYTPCLSDDIRIFINYFLKQILDDDKVFQEHLKDIKLDIPDFIKTQSTNDLITKLEKEIDDNLDPNSNSILAKLNKTEYAVEDLIVEFKNYTIFQGDDKIGYTKIKLGEVLIEILKDKLALLWQYSEMDLHTDSKSVRKPEKIFVIGSYTGEEKFITNNVITKLQIANLRLKGETRVATNDINRLTFHIQEDAVPAFKLRGMDKTRKDFFNAKNANENYFYTDKRIELNAPDIFPQEDEDELMKFWSIGIMTGYIFNERRGYYIRSSKGSTSTKVALFDGSVGKNNRKLAFEIFSHNDDFRSEIEDRYDSMFNRDKPALIKDLLDYFNNKIFHRNNLGKELRSLDENEKQLLLKERKKLVEIGLFDLKMNDFDFINEDIKNADEKKYEHHIQELQSLGLQVHM